MRCINLFALLLHRKPPRGSVRTLRVGIHAARPQPSPADSSKPSPFWKEKATPEIAGTGAFKQEGERSAALGCAWTSLDRQWGTPSREGPRGAPGTQTLQTHAGERFAGGSSALRQASGRQPGCKGVPACSRTANATDPGSPCKRTNAFRMMQVPLHTPDPSVSPTVSN